MFEFIGFGLIVLNKKQKMDLNNECGIQGSDWQCGKFGGNWYECSVVIVDCFDFSCCVGVGVFWFVGDVDYDIDLFCVYRFWFCLVCYC